MPCGRVGKRINHFFPTVKYHNGASIVGHGGQRGGNEKSVVEVASLLVKLCIGRNEGVTMRRKQAKLVGNGIKCFIV